MGRREQIQERLLDAVTGERGVRVRHKLFDIRNRVKGEERRVRFFFGYHSPYAYLMAPQILEIPDRYQIAVDWLPVAPPTELEDNYELRTGYAVADCRREAEFLRMPFKREAPPSHDAVLEAIAATEAARGLGDVAPFVVTLNAAIWAEGMEPSDPTVLGRVCEQLGISYDALSKAKLGIDAEKIAAANAALLESLGHWDAAVAELDREFFMSHGRMDFLTERLDALGLAR